MNIVKFIELTTVVYELSEYVSEVSELLQNQANITDSKAKILEEKNKLDNIKNTILGFSGYDFGTKKDISEEMNKTINNFYILHSKLNQAISDNDENKLTKLKDIFKELKNKFDNLLYEFVKN